ncbi:hypothetical protein KBK19_19375 [Microvirga sp. STR05]|uniref:DUF2946 domain-containing protein n=1 Tax=Hymenobacter duratus TaxID=2771356 RepID=A0ABR8JNM3_9BACT|nr:DUF6660 family protein [Hymenobacter duratus]MBD2717211.1 hypothetical protein [Hymenobacter duratus]MBR7952130.1 hypothetical protein [Microvirga sp. STR05]
MRFFSVFFALYLAILACLPCADAAPVPVDGARSFVSAGEHKPAAHEQLDWCSPLCQCHCCSGTSLPSATGTALPLPAVPVAAAQCFARLLPPAPQQRAGSIWQPPQA